MATLQHGMECMAVMKQCIWSVCQVRDFRSSGRWICSAHPQNPPIPNETAKTAFAHTFGCIRLEHTHRHHHCPQSTKPLISNFLWFGNTLEFVFGNHHQCFFCRLENAFAWLWIGIRVLEGCECCMLKLLRLPEV